MPDRAVSPLKVGWCAEVCERKEGERWREGTTARAEKGQSIMMPLYHCAMSYTPVSCDSLGRWVTSAEVLAGPRRTMDRREADTETRVKITAAAVAE